MASVENPRRRFLNRAEALPAGVTGKMSIMRLGSRNHVLWMSHLVLVGTRIIRGVGELIAGPQQDTDTRFYTSKNMRFVLAASEYIITRRAGA